MSYLEKWKKYQKWLVELINNSKIPLFETSDDKIIKVKVKNNQNKIIQRHPLMEQLLINACSYIHHDYKNNLNIYEGIISFIYIFKGNEIIPLFFCQSGKYGRDKLSLNQNLKDTYPNSKDKNYFARWGDNPARHIGELSDAMFNNLRKPERRKIKWKNYLFNDTEFGYQLKTQIFFFAKAWSIHDVDYYGKKVSMDELIEEIISDFSPLLMGSRDPDLILMDFNNIENFDIIIRLEFTIDKWRLSLFPQFFNDKGLNNSIDELALFYPEAKKNIDDLVQFFKEKNCHSIDVDPASNHFTFLLNNEQASNFLRDIYPNYLLKKGILLEADIISIYRELVPTKQKRNGSTVIKSQIFELGFNPEIFETCIKTEKSNQIARITFEKLNKIIQKISNELNFESETKYHLDKKSEFDFNSLINKSKPKIDYEKVLKSEHEYLEMEPPPSFQGSLFKFQKQGLKFLSKLCDNNIGALLSDDMGLGKTVQCISYLHHRNANFELKSVLIICPASVIFQWQNEIKKYSKNLFNIFIYHGKMRNEILTKNYNTPRSIFITTHATLSRDIEHLKSIEWDGIIIDEIHRAKTMYTKINIALFQLNATFKIALTGTPIENSITDIYPIIHFLNPGYLGTFDDFRSKYLNSIREKIQNDVDCIPELDELKKKIGKIILRRTKEEMRNYLSSLPIKKELELIALMTPQQEEALDEISLEFKNNRDPNDKLYLITKLKQLCNHPALVNPLYSENFELSGKMEILFDLMRTILKKGEKLVIFTQYKETIKLLKNQIKICYNCEVFEISGDISPISRQKIIEVFNNNSQHKILIISLMAGSEGVNLNTTKHLILFDSWWNFSKEQQAKDRIFRINQTNKEICVYKLWTKNSIEEYIIKLIKNKKELSEELLEKELIERI